MHSRVEISFFEELNSDVESLNKERATYLLSKLENEITELKKKLLATFIPYSEQLIQNLNLAKQSQFQLQELQSQFQNIYNILYGKDIGIILKLQEHEKKKTYLKNEIHSINFFVTILKSLIDMKSLLFQVDEEMEKSLFLKATQIFMELENRVQSKPEVFQKIKVFHDIQERFYITRKSLKDKTEISWNKLVKIDNSTIIIHSQLDNLNLIDIKSSFLATKVFESKIKDLSIQCRQTLFSVLLENPHSSLDFQIFAPKFQVAIELTTSPNSSALVLDLVFEKLFLILEFINKYLLTSVEEMQSFYEVIWLEFSVSIREKCLLPFIPEESKFLLQFEKDVVESIKKFKDKCRSIHFYSDKNDSHPLLEFATNIEFYFWQTKRQKILEKGKKLMLTEFVNNIQFTPKSANETGYFVFPKCKISVCTSQLLELVRYTLNEAIHSKSESSNILITTARDLFEVFIAVIPIHYIMKLQTVPQLSVIFHNDCMYLAHNLLLLSNSFSSRLKIKNSSLIFVDLIPKLRNLGTQCFKNHLETQFNQMIGSLTKNLADSHTENNFVQIQKSFQQIIHQISIISKIWKDTLPSSFYLQSIGVLINQIIVLLIEKVLELNDIGEEEGQKLHELLSIFFQCEGLFPNKKIDNYIHSWGKFKKVRDLLLLRLAEIETEYNSGGYSEFSKQELVQLIKALFNDSVKRKKFLENIQK